MTANFTVLYDSVTNMIKMDNRSGKEARISYFSDFVFMQQLMTIEIDIIIGQTADNIRHLAGLHINSDTLKQMKAHKHRSGDKNENEFKFLFK